MVKAKFAFYNPGFEEILPFPSYYIVKSTVPQLPRHGNVSEHQLQAANVPIPITPTYEEWDYRTGRKERCRHCWATTRGASDLLRHLKLKHFLKFKK